jgi:membrane peptidoglycan carboxypeptidase
MMSIEELRRALDHETAGLRANMPAGRVRRRALVMRRRRRGITVATIFFTAALAAVGGAFALQTTPAPIPPAVPSPTTLYYSDGRTVLARLDNSEPAVSPPVELVVNHVLDELSHSEGSPLRGQSWESIENGGYAITTTIDQRAQTVLEKTADETVDGSVMYGQPENLQAAGAVVEPGTGRVLAYYGGHDGRGPDYAGFYFDEKNEPTGVGRYPPGSTFMAYTLAAALKAGYSIKSRWQWTQHAQPGRPVSNPIRNVSACASNLQGSSCTLVDSVRNSLNVPLYDVTVSLSPAKVLAMARDAGIDYMWTDDRVRVDLRAADPIQLTPSRFDMILGLGQYPVTVLDQANAMATFAADGLRAKVHFVRSVSLAGKARYAETLPAPDQSRILNRQQIADFDYTLTVGNIAMKTGTWEYNNRTDQNAHAWSIGYDSTLATAIWVGNGKDEQAITDKTGATIWGSGLPSQILRKVLADTRTQLGLTATPFPLPAFIGDENPPGSVPN